MNFELIDNLFQVATLGCAAVAALKPLQDVETLSKALIVYHLALPQEVQRFNDLRVGGHIHQMLIGRAGLLLCCHILHNVGNRIAGDGEHAAGKWYAVGICREYAMVVHGIVAGKPCVRQLLAGAALHALADHGAKHLPVPHFFRTNIRQRCLNAVVRHGEALRQVAQTCGQLCVSQRRAYF